MMKLALSSTSVSAAKQWMTLVGVLALLLALAAPGVQARDEMEDDDDGMGNDMFADDMDEDDMRAAFRADAPPAPGKKPTNDGKQSASSGNNTAPPPQCSLTQKCFSNKDCGGVEGDNTGPKCSGGLVGRCNCASCVQGKTCSDDTACGNLKGACAIGNKPITAATVRAAAAEGKPAPVGSCGCLQMAQRTLNETQVPAGQTKPTLAKAITDFCSTTQTACSPDTCFGMQCVQGFCSNCAAKAKAPAPGKAAPGAAPAPIAAAPGKAPAPGKAAAPAADTGRGDAADNDDEEMED